jgi:hypothetical protein
MVYHTGAVAQFRSADAEVVEAVAGADHRETLEAAWEKQEAAKERRAGPVRFQKIRKFLADHVLLYNLLRIVRQRFNDLFASSIGNMHRTELTEGEYAVLKDGGGYRTIFTPRYRLIALDLADARIAEGLRTCLECLKAVFEQLTVARVLFVVVIIPTKELVHEREIRNYWKDDIPSDLAKQLANEKEAISQAKEFLAHNGIPFVDVTAALRQAMDRGWQLYPETDDGHPNAAGYRVIAEFLAGAIPLPTRNLKHHD